MTTIELTEAARRLGELVGGFEPRRGPRHVAGYLISPDELEAITFAAAFLGVFAESLEAPICCRCGVVESEPDLNGLCVECEDDVRSREGF